MTIYTVYFTASKRAAFFIDPPYTKAARRLYNNWEFNHEYLFELLTKFKCPFLVTYDDTTEITRLAEKHSLTYRTIAMKTTHHLQKKELLISRDFDWFDSIPL